MQERHIMLDIETLGNGSNACIVSIGAVEFCAKTGEIGKTFEVIVDPEDSAKYGILDASTVVWWMRQCDGARQRTFPTKGLKDLKTSLILLSAFVGEGDDLHGVWGNGATFDNVILHNAAKQVGMRPMWEFRLDRDLRTMVWLDGTLGVLAPLPDSESITAHAALDDAIWQAKRLANILIKLRGIMEV